MVCILNRENIPRLVSTNLLGFLYMTQLTVKQMLKQNSGNVVSITASLADQPVTRSLPLQARANVFPGPYAREG
jgi:NADP-dependent 3-hydroxy acid dehydrogenase YdfG